MIAGLCESPLTFQAIIIWRDELNEGKVFLRDIIDLEATYAGPDANGDAGAGRPRRPSRSWSLAVPYRTVTVSRRRWRRPATAPAGATPFNVPPRPGSAHEDGEEKPEGRRNLTSTIDDMEGFAVAGRDRGRAQAQGARDLRQGRERGCARAGCKTRTSRCGSRASALDLAQERKYKKLKEEIIAEVKSPRLNQARIDLTGRAALRHQQAPLSATRAG